MSTFTIPKSHTKHRNDINGHVQAFIASGGKIDCRPIERRAVDSKYNNKIVKRAGERIE